MARTGVVIVYWDGRCPFCTELARRLRRVDTEHALRLVDYQDPAVAITALPRFTYSDLDREMHAYMSDGTWRIGYFAWATVLRRLPPWRWVGALMELPFLTDVGPKAYRWIANRRILISKLLGLPEPCAAGGACDLKAAAPGPKPP